MKKLIFTVVTCLMLSLASCGSSADYEAIHKKLEQNEKPTTADYSAMATYVEECVDEMISLSKPISTANLFNVSRCTILLRVLVRKPSRLPLKWRKTMSPTTASKMASPKNSSRSLLIQLPCFFMDEDL